MAVCDIKFCFFFYLQTVLINAGIDVIHSFTQSASTSYVANFKKNHAC